MSDPDEPAAQPDLSAIVEQVEERLLGGRRTHTRGAVAAAAGLPAQDARKLWQALGFAAVSDDEPAFTDADIEALKLVGGLSNAMSLDDDVLLSMARMLGRTFSRLASWQGQIVVEQFGTSPELLRSPEDVLDSVDQILDTMQQLQTYVWRRQLAAYFARVVTNAALATGAETTMVVGFADLAQFTALTRRSSEADLRMLLETFESLATAVVGSNRGQVVKTIGDEVLFVVDDPQDGAEIALGLLAGAEGSEILPPLRVGLASGPVVSRLGDVFGATVNIASRLTSVARTGSILVDEGMSTALSGSDEYALRSLRPLSVRGYQHLRSWRLRRRSEPRRDT